MPTLYSERLYIAPEDRWNTYKALEKVSAPGDVISEYLEKESCFVISSRGGYAQKVMKHKKDMWMWFLAHRRVSRRDSVNSSPCVSPDSYISEPV